MWIWFGLTVLSLMLGTMIYPWHNLPQDLTEGGSLICIVWANYKFIINQQAFIQFILLTLEFVYPSVSAFFKVRNTVSHILFTYSLVATVPMSKHKT